MSTHVNRKRNLLLIDQVDALNEEVKVLALNLAIYLAKAKSNHEYLQQLEPDFIRLVNGTVKVVQELAVVIDAARNQKLDVESTTPDNIQSDLLEAKLHSILGQCNKIMNILSKDSRLCQ
ncbi:MAG: hypothetical protein ACE5K8_01175 [Candidatus Zixiibacteriota bacterium]